MAHAGPASAPTTCSTCWTSPRLSLIHRQRLLFLDEPSAGLDPRSRADIWAQILRLRREHGITVVLTTHYLDEADRVAERVVIVDAGRVIADGTPARLKAALGGDQIRITTETPADAGVAASIGARFTTPERVGTDGTAVTLRLVRADRELPRFLRELDHAGVTVTTAASSRPSLDDVFLTLTGRRLRESGDADPVHPATDPVHPAS